MANTRTFTKEFLKNELDLPDAAIKDTIVDTSRWSIHHEIIFEFQGKFYRTYYSVGATETQDESPWKYDDKIKCTEVEIKQVLVSKWVAKESE